MKRNKSISYWVFQIVNTSFLVLLAITCVLPFLHIVAVSFSDSASTSAGTVGLLPIGFQWNAYERIIDERDVFVSLFVTVIRMFFGTIWLMVITISAAYPLSLSRQEFYGRRIFVGFFFVSMLFSGGIIPYYILIKDLGLMNSIWALIVGGTPVFNAIILMNFFRSIPHGLYEAAAIDGASHWKILTRIYLPLSKPSLATLSLFCVVAHWNDWFSGLVYMKDKTKYPLQTYIYSFTQYSATYFKSEMYHETAPRMAIISALNVCAFIPVIVIFPLLLKYVARRGIMIGSVKE